MNLIKKLKAFFKKEEEKSVETPDIIFKNMKNNTYQTDQNGLDEYENNLKVMAAEFIETTQYKSLERIAFLMKCVDKERKLVELGINKYIFRDDIDEFLSRRDIQESSIRLIELSDYPRRIPSDIQKKIKQTKGIFDHMYVMFTDYTGNVTKNHMRNKKNAQKDKDPILFGTFQSYGEDSETFLDGQAKRRRIPTRLLNDRFYVIGDWVDEYCDLTLDKFLELSKAEAHTIEKPVTMEEIEAAINKFREIPDME